MLCSIKLVLANFTETPTFKLYLSRGLHFGTGYLIPCQPIVLLTRTFIKVLLPDDCGPVIATI